MAQDLKQFLFSDLAGYIVTDRGPENLGLHRWQGIRPFFDQRFADGCKRVSVIENERAQVLALPANV